MNRQQHAATDVRQRAAADGQQCLPEDGQQCGLLHSVQETPTTGEPSATRLESSTHFSTALTRRMQAGADGVGDHVPTPTAPTIASTQIDLNTDQSTSSAGVALGIKSRALVMEKLNHQAALSASESSAIEKRTSEPVGDVDDHEEATANLDLNMKSQLVAMEEWESQHFELFPILRSAFLKRIADCG